MAEDAVAFVSIVPESSGVGAKIAQQFDGAGVGAQMSDSVSKGFLAKVGSIGLGITKVVGGAVAVSAGLITGLALKGGLERSLDIQGAEAKLAGLGHSTKSVADIMDNALASVKGTAFGLGDAATVAATAVAANVKPGKDLTRYLTLMADASTIAGTSMADMGQIFNQVAARGSLTGDVVNQLQQRGIPILQLVADQYGVTAGAAADMVSAGQVDFATFEKAIESGMGGAALKSGNTAAGAFANVQAALSRLGQGFTDPIVASAPTLFDAIGKATDNAAAALKPYADKFAAWITPAIGSLSTWIASIDFTVVIQKVQAFFGSVKAAFSGTSDAFSGLDLGGAFGTLFQILNPLMPIFVGIAQGIGTIAGSIGNLIGAGIGLLPPIIDAFAGALGFLKDNSGLVAPLLIAIVGALVLYRASQIAANIASLAMIPAYVGRTAALIATATATVTATEAENLSTVAVQSNKLALLLNVGAWIAAKAAMIAGAVATGVVTAAQWAWNVAMSANPIGLVILAIAALIAIIILVVANWQTIVDFLYNVWNAVVTWTMGVLSSFFTFWVSVWTQVVGFFISIWTWIVATATFYINTVFLIINTVIAAIVSVWNTVWGAISSFFVSIWDGIVSFVTFYINTVMAIISAVGSAISGVWSGIWNGIVGFFTGAWNNIMGVLNTIGSAFGNAFGSVAGIVSGAFNGIVGVIRGAINSVIDLVNGAIGTINDTIGAAGAAFGINIKIGKIPRLENGGIVSHGGGGIIANIGEGRYDEAVVPLSPKVLDALGGGGSSFPSTVVLRVGDREFTAYVDERASGVVSDAFDADGAVHTRGFAGF